MKEPVKDWRFSQVIICFFGSNFLKNYGYAPQVVLWFFKNQDYQP
jgi:hypothetical protein